MAPDKRDQETRFVCPVCGGEVGRRALLCPHCREPLTGKNQPVAIEREETPPPAPPEPRKPERPAPAPMAPSPAIPEPRQSPTNLPPLGRALTPAEQGNVLTNLLERAEQGWSTYTRTPSQRKRLKIAGSILGVSFILWVWVLFIRPSGPRPASPAPRGETSVIAATQQGGGRTAPTAGPSVPMTGIPSTSDSSAGQETASSASSSKEAQWANVLDAAAQQIMRMAPYLASSTNPTAPPANPKSSEDVLPPVPPDVIAPPSASQEARERYRQFMQDREDLLNEVASNLSLARGLAITKEQAMAVAAILKEEAAALLGQSGPADATNPSAQWSAPGGPLTVDEIQKILETLLGKDDADQVMDIRKRL